MFEDIALQPYFVIPSSNSTLSRLLGKCVSNVTGPFLLQSFTVVKNGYMIVCRIPHLRQLRVPSGQADPGPRPQRRQAADGKLSQALTQRRPQDRLERTVPRRLPLRPARRSALSRKKMTRKDKSG